MSWRSSFVIIRRLRFASLLLESASLQWCADYQVGQRPSPALVLLEVVFNHGVAVWITPEQTEPCLVA
jgi:hypothetical protein